MLTLVLFMGVNLSNRCDVSVVFHTFKDVPIFLSTLFAFLLGNIAVLPFLISSRYKMKKAEKHAALHDVKTVELKPEKHHWFSRGKNDAEKPALREGQ